MSKITYPTFNLQQPGQAPGGINVGQVLQNAVGMHRAGQLDAAEKNYRLVLQVQPGNAYALNMLGVLHSQKGEYRKGEKLLKKAVKTDPDVADYHCNLGQCLQEQAKSGEAESEFKKTLQIDPNYVPALFGLGNVNLQLKQPEQAITYYKKAIETEPRYLPAYNNLGNLYREYKRYDEALEMFNRALELKPDFAEGWYNAGQVHYVTLDGQKAVNAFQKAVQIKPDYHRARIKLGDTYGLLLNDADSALSAFNYVLESNPDYLPAYLHKAQVYQAMGQFEQSEKTLREMLEIDDSMISVYLQLIKGKVYNEKDITKVQSVMNEIDLDESQQAQINFALGGIYNDREEYEKAFQLYQHANQLHRRTFQYDPDSNKKRIARLIDTYTPDFIREYSKYGLQTEQMVFIVGMPRSGTTLTEQIIASHPSVYGASESEYLHQASLKFSSLFNEMDGHGASTSELLHEEDIQRIATTYLSQVSPDTDVLRITDKTPKNYLYLGLIAILFPRAKIIHCQRDPMDTCLSIYFQHFASHHPYAYDLREIGLDYRDYRQLMAHWQSVLGERILNIQYEELVQDLEQVSRQLIDHIQLPWDEACLQYSKTQRAVRTSSQWQVRQDIYTGSIGRWRHYRPWLGPLIKALGDFIQPDVTH